MGILPYRIVCQSSLLSHNELMTFDEFKNVELRAATVITADRVPNSDKLIKMRVRLGDPSLGTGLDDRQIIAGIGKAYEPGDLVGRQVVIVANLDPKTLMGEESKGMVLAAIGSDGMPVLLRPDRDVPPGSEVR